MHPLVRPQAAPLPVHGASTLCYALYRVKAGSATLMPRDVGQSTLALCLQDAFASIEQRPIPVCKKHCQQSLLKVALPHENDT